MNEITNQEKIELAVEECAAIFSVGLQNYAKTLVETNHLIGERILQAVKETGAAKDMILQLVANRIKKSKRYVYQCIQFVEKFPTLDLIEKSPEYKKLPYAKQPTWREITQLLLPDSKKEVGEHEHIWEVKCKICGKKKDN